jgi:glucokinase-like ROK family protein
MATRNTAGLLLQLIRSGQAVTRAELAAVTGLARSTVSQRVDRLIEHGYVVEAGEGPSHGGRPPMVLGFDREAGVVLAADLGATHCRLAVCDLDGEPLAEDTEDLAIALGPDHVLAWVADRFDELLATVGREPEDVRGIGVGLPGPVEFAAGRAVNPPIMPGWDGVAVSERLQERFAVPVLVDNDVNIMALGEYVSVLRDTAEDMLFVKVGTGIGCGIVAGGRVHRGAQGAAGDIGHIRLADHAEAMCRCGNRGCVEALAGGAALARQLTDLGFEARDSREVVSLVRAGNAAAVRLVREAGRMLGEVLAGIVNFFNPKVIVIGGDVSEADEQLLAGVREIVYQRSTALATRHLQIRRSQLGDRAGVYGAAAMVLDEILAPEAVDGALEMEVAVSS